MDEKSFLIDIRSRAPGKFQQQVELVVEAILKGDNLRLHCPDPEYGKRFIEAVDKMLGHI